MSYYVAGGKLLLEEGSKTWTYYVGDGLRQTRIYVCPVYINRSFILVELIAIAKLI